MFQIQSGYLTCTLSCLRAVILKVTTGVTPAFSTNRGVHCTMFCFLKLVTIKVRIRRVFTTKITREHVRTSHKICLFLRYPKIWKGLLHLFRLFLIIFFCSASLLKKSVLYPILLTPSGDHEGYKEDSPRSWPKFLHF